MLRGFKSHPILQFIEFQGEGMAKKSVQHSSNENQFDTLIVTVLDCSGSMGPRVNDVIGNYNWFIGEQKKFGRAKVSLYRFDTVYETIYEDRDINEIPELTTTDYFSRGGTALNDAVGKTIHAVDRLKNKPSKIIIAINTDGEENSSREFKLAQIQELVTERTENHDWQFIYLGASLNEFEKEAHAMAAGAMHFLNNVAFDNTPTGYMSSTQAYNQSVSAYRSGAAKTVNMNTGNSTPVSK